MDEGTENRNETGKKNFLKHNRNKKTRARWMKEKKTKTNNRSDRTKG